MRDFSGNDSLKQQALQALQSLVTSDGDTPGNNVTTSQQLSALPSDMSKSPSQTDLLSLCYDKPTIDKSINDEVLLWSQSIFDAETTNVDLLTFWRKKQHEFPKIAAIARKVLAIPASNTSVERLFSLAKVAVNDRRTSLGIEKIDKLMFLKKNLMSLEHMFDTNDSSTSLHFKRKINEANSNVISNGDNGCAFVKKHRSDEDTDCVFLSDEYESGIED